MTPRNAMRSATALPRVSVVMPVRDEAPYIERSLGAVLAQDYPVVMAVVILGAIATILGYLLSDILYALIDPRIRLV